LLIYWYIFIYLVDLIDTFYQLPCRVCMQLINIHGYSSIIICMHTYMCCACFDTLWHLTNNSEISNLFLLIGACKEISYEIIHNKYKHHVYAAYAVLNRAGTNSRIHQSRHNCMHIIIQEIEHRMIHLNKANKCNCFLLQCFSIFISQNLFIGIFLALILIVV